MTDRMRIALLLAALTLPLVAAQGLPGEATPPGSIAFLARNSIVKADGSFRSWRVIAAELDRSDPPAGFVEIEIEVASIDTGIARRDDHLRSADFFDVETWSQARVRVHGAKPDGRSQRGNPQYVARFDLRIRDVEKTLEGRFELIDDIRVEGSLTLDRTEFGVGTPRNRWNPLSVHDEVVVRYTATLPAP